jgi:putative addiction module component (TIGR02574 family)
MLHTMTASTDITSMLQSILDLPLPERSYIAERLLVSLDDDGEISPEWRTELDARVRSREAGETRSFSKEEVHQRIQSLLA